MRSFMPLDGASESGTGSLPAAFADRLFFEDPDSELDLVWRRADSLTLRDFQGLELSEAPTDHSSFSRTRRLIDVKTHQEVFS